MQLLISYTVPFLAWSGSSSNSWQLRVLLAHVKPHCLVYAPGDLFRFNWMHFFFVRRHLAVRNSPPWTEDNITDAVEWLDAENAAESKKVFGDELVQFWRTCSTVWDVSRHMHKERNLPTLILSIQPSGILSSSAGFSGQRTLHYFWSWIGSRGGVGGGGCLSSYQLSSRCRTRDQ